MVVKHNSRMYFQWTIILHPTNLKPVICLNVLDYTKASTYTRDGKLQVKLQLLVCYWIHVETYHVTPGV